MRTKKADSGVSFWLVVGILAVIVLVIVVAGLYLFGGDFSKFFSWLPNFGNKTEEPIKGIEIFRYNIATDTIEYYDGTKFSEFKAGEAIRLGDKKIEGDNLAGDFKNYYYKTEREKEGIELNQPLITIMNYVDFSNPQIPFNTQELDDFKKLNNLGNLNLFPSTIYIPKSFAEKEQGVYNKDLGIYLSESKSTLYTKNGDVLFWLKRSIEESLGANAGFRLSLDNKLYVDYNTKGGPKYKEITNHEGDTLSKVYNNIKNWRDSVFAKPIPITISPATTDIELDSPIYACTNLIDNKYIVVDLANKVGKESSCP